MKRIALLLLCFVAAFHATGQVIIVPMPHQEGYFSLDDVWRVNLISSQPQSVSVQLDVTIENGQHQMVLMATSPAFNLMQGSNRPSFNASGAKVQYGTGSATKVLRSTGRFPYGNYIVCYRVTVVENNAILSEFCQEETVKPFSPPELISPYNGEDITTTLPILIWKPPFPLGTTPFEYTLRLVEVKENQDAIEALETNAPLVIKRGIFGTHLPYPGDAPKLEMGKIYAWQVAAKSGDFQLGITEIWIFKVAEKAIMRSNEVVNTYRELKLKPEGSFNPAKQELRFVYDNRWGAPNLEYENSNPPSDLEMVYYKIYPVGKQASPIRMTISIALITGINKLVISLESIAGINNGEDYVMALRDPIGKEYFLEFTYIVD